MIGVFSALGIGVSAGIIAFGGGFSGAGGNIFDPPSDADIYRVGEAVTDGMRLDYDLTAAGPSTTLIDADVSISFERQQAGDGWLATFNIVNGTNGQAQTIEQAMSDQLTKEGQVGEEQRAFLEPVESSILAIRDMDYGGRDKYLSPGAPWNTIFYGSSSTIVRVTGQEQVSTPAGTFDAFVLSYTLGEKTSRIWVVKDLPFPVKAEVYDPSDQPLYSYELTGLAK